MNKLDKVKLSIYEDVNLSNDDKLHLLILAEEKHEEISDEDKSANRIFIEAYKDAAGKYHDDIKEAKELLNQSRYTHASIKLKVARNDLLKLNKLVDETPSTLTQTAISQCVSVLKNALISYTIQTVIDKLFSKQKKELENVGTTYIDNTQMSKEQKKIAKEGLKKTLGKPSIVDCVTDEISMELIKDGLKLLSGKNPITDRNHFKDVAKKRIKKELDLIDRLEGQIQKLK